MIFSIPHFANDVLRFMNENKIEVPSIFGYSMGGYVGSYIAKHFPQRVEKLITLATKFNWDEKIAAREIKFLDVETIEQKIPVFAEDLQRRHAPQDWKLVIEKTRQMLLQQSLPGSPFYHDRLITKGMV